MKTNEMEQGWAFAARLAGAEHSATVGRTYVNEVAKAITCFGLVEQDYTLPDEVLSDMGIEKIRIARTPVKRNAVAKATVSHAGSRTKYETIDIHMLRRGVIGVNKIGYVL